MDWDLQLFTPPTHSHPPPLSFCSSVTYLAKSFHLTQPSTPFPCYITQCPMDPAPSLAAPSSPYVLTHLMSPCLLPEDFRGSHVALHKTMPRLHVVESILTDKRIHLFPTIWKSMDRDSYNTIIFILIYYQLSMHCFGKPPPQKKKRFCMMFFNG